MKVVSLIVLFERRHTLYPRIFWFRSILMTLGSYREIETLEKKINKVITGKNCGDWKNYFALG